MIEVRRMVYRGRMMVIGTAGFILRVVAVPGVLGINDYDNSNEFDDADNLANEKMIPLVQYR